MISNNLAKQLGINSNLASQASLGVNICVATLLASDVSLLVGGKKK
jgi:hypothetical protein